MQFKYVNVYVLTNLFKCYVWPIFEYESVVWSHHHIYLKDVIENVQHNQGNNS